MESNVLPDSAKLDAVLDNLRQRLEPGHGVRSGRPTVARWSVRRQIPLAEDTLRQLEAIAEQGSVDGRAISPMHVAGAIVEAVISEWSRATAEESVKRENLEGCQDGDRTANQGTAA